MRRLPRLLALLGINGVPIAGLALADWSGATVLALYWCESVLAALLVAARIALHREMTHKRGHYRAQLGVTVSSGSGSRETTHELRSFLAEFLVGSLVFSAAHGLFLALLLVGLLERPIERTPFLLGLGGMGGFLLVGFLVDLVGLRQRSFAWIKLRAQEVMGRVALLHVAIIAGVAVVAWREGSAAFFLPFAALKAAADLLGFLFGRSEQREIWEERPPGWLTRAIDRLKPNEDFAAYWSDQREQERRRTAEDEERVVAGRRARRA